MIASVPAMKLLAQSAKPPIAETKLLELNQMMTKNFPLPVSLSLFIFINLIYRNPFYVGTVTIIIITFLCVFLSFLFLFSTPTSSFFPFVFSSFLFHHVSGYTLAAIPPSIFCDNVNERRVVHSRGNEKRTSLNP